MKLEKIASNAQKHGIETRTYEATLTTISERAPPRREHYLEISAKSIYGAVDKVYRILNNKRSGEHLMTGHIKTPEGVFYKFCEEGVQTMHKPKHSYK